MRLIWRDFHVNLSDFLDQATGNVHRSVINRTERQAPRYNFRRYFELNPVMPLGMLFIICAIIFFLLIFRRWPGVVAGIIAGTLTSVSVYFLLLALRIDKSVYE